MNDPLGLFDSSSSTDKDPLGLFEGTSKEKTSFAEDVKIGLAQVTNTFTKGKQLTKGAIATALGDTELADQYYNEMRDTVKKRLQDANPLNKEQSFGGKLAGTVATLPFQMAAMPFSPFDTGEELISSGESLPVAMGGAAIDTAMNAVGVGLPGFMGKKAATKIASGFGINAAQDVATRASISGLVQTEEAKKKFEPTLESAALSGVVGAGFGAIGSRKKVSDEDTKLKTLLAKQAEIDAKKAAEKAKAEQPLQNLTSLEDENGQMSLFDQQDMVQNRQPYQAEFGDWRIDENGMPIKADLSMEVQNLQQPLQRNLWGDELAPKSEQEAFPITQAIDQMPDAPWRTERDEGLDLLRGEIAAPGELKAAMMEAEGPKIPFNFKKQGGALDPEVFKEGYVAAAKALSRLTDKLAMDSEWQYRIWNDDNVRSVFDYEPPSTIKSPGNKQRGGILFDFGKKKQTPDATDIPRIQKQIDELGRRYVGGGLSFDEFKEENTKLITQKLEAERLEKRRQESIPAKSVEPIFPGFNVIPVGTKIKASHGLNYPKGSEGTVVGTFDFRDGDKAYKLPVVDFGDGRGRKILPMDIEEVFAPRTIASPGNKQRGGC